MDMLVDLFDESRWTDLSIESVSVSREMSRLHRSVATSFCSAVGLTNTISVLEKSSTLDFSSTKAALSVGFVFDEESRLKCKDLREHTLFLGQEDMFLLLCEILGDRNDASDVALTHLTSFISEHGESFLGPFNIFCCFVFGYRSQHECKVLSAYHFAFDDTESFHLIDHQLCNATLISRKLLGGTSALISSMVLRRAVSMDDLRSFALDTFQQKDGPLLKSLLKELSDAHALKFAYYKLLFSTEFLVEETEFFSRVYCSSVVDANADASSGNPGCDEDAVKSTVSALLLIFAGGGKKFVSFE